MAKRCPACGYGPIGPFTDNCPICAEPVRNVRSGGGGFGRPGGWPPVLTWVLGGVLAAVLLIGGCCGIGLWRFGNGMQNMQQEIQRAQEQAEADRKARTVAVNAADLLGEFRADPAAADRKYEGKYLELTGIVERTGRGKEGAFVVLHGGDEAAKVKIECFFDYVDRAEESRLLRLKPGQTITVRGEYDGQVSHVQLRECVLVK
jgi:hypothetical protein